MSLFGTFGSDDMVTWTEEKRQKYSRLWHRMLLFLTVSFAGGPFISKEMWGGHLRKVAVAIWVISSVLFVIYSARCRRMERRTTSNKPPNDTPRNLLKH